MLRNESKIYYKGSCNSTICSACSRDISGGYSDGVPPLPIPNREVKPDRADGTAHPRESRSPPFYKTSLETRKRLGALLCLDGWGQVRWGSRRVCLGDCVNSNACGTNLLFHCICLLVVMVCKSERRTFVLCRAAVVAQNVS